ncbi:MAG: RNA-binding protein [Bryobacteraceae bacterium]
MPKRTRTPKLDVVQNARRVVIESISETETIGLTIVSQVMAEMGRKGGKIGGKRRMDTMTPEARSASASKAAKTRWAKKPKKA